MDCTSAKVACDFDISRFTYLRTKRQTIITTVSTLCPPHHVTNFLFNWMILPLDENIRFGLKLRLDQNQVHKFQAQARLDFRVHELDTRFVVLVTCANDIIIILLCFWSLKHFWEKLLTSATSRFGVKLFWLIQSYHQRHMWIKFAL